MQELAEGANAVTGDAHVEMTIASDAGPNQAEIDAVTAFMEAATPAAVLALLAEINRLRTAEGDAMTYKAGMENVAQQRDQIKAERDQLFGNSEQLKAENDRLRSGFADALVQKDQLKVEVESFKAANAELSEINVARRNHLSNAKKAAGIGPMDDLVGAIEAMRKDAGRLNFLDESAMALKKSLDR